MVDAYSVLMDGEKRGKYDQKLAMDKMRKKNGNTFEFRIPSFIVSQLNVAGLIRVLMLLAILSVVADAVQKMVYKLSRAGQKQIPKVPNAILDNGMEMARMRQQARQVELSKAIKQQTKRRW